MKKYLKKVMSVLLVFTFIVTSTTVVFAKSIDKVAEEFSNDGKIVKITGEIKWDDKDNKELTRPEKVKVNLLKDGKILESKEISEKENWEYSFSDLPVYNNKGEKIEYKIDGDMNSEKYENKVSEYNILSSLKLEEIDFTVSINWKDNNNTNKLRPSKLTVVLTKDGKNTENKIILNESTGWKYKFTLPKHGNEDTKYEAIVEEYPKGYEFAGKEITPDGINLTLEDTAKVEDKFKIEYDSNSGKGSVVDANSPYNKDDEVTVLSKGNFTKEDYEFVEWNTQSNGKGKSYKEGDKLNITEDITLYAQWKLLQYEVKYDSNYGTGTVKDKKSPYNKDSKVTVLGDDDLSRTGYKFTEWNTKSNGKGKSYKEGDTFEIVEDTTLYAQWERKSSTTTGSGSSSSSSSTTLPKTGTANVIGFTVAGISLIGVGSSFLLKNKKNKK